MCDTVVLVQGLPPEAALDLISRQRWATLLEHDELSQDLSSGAVSPRTYIDPVTGTSIGVPAMGANKRS